LVSLGIWSVAALLNCQDVDPKFIGAEETAYQHLLVLGDTDTLSLNDLDIVETTEDLMLHLELGTHGKLGTLLDLERLILEGLFRSRSGKVNGDRRPACRVHCQGQDDALAWVIGVRDALSTAAESEGFFVPL